LETSSYQALKLWLQGYIPLDRDQFHLLIGAVILLAVWLWKRPVLAAFGIALLAGVAMEVLDARDDLRSFGYWRWFESLTDIFLTIAVPLLANVLIWGRRRLP